MLSAVQSSSHFILFNPGSEPRREALLSSSTDGKTEALGKFGDLLESQRDFQPQPRAVAILVCQPSELCALGLKPSACSFLSLLFAFKKPKYVDKVKHLFKKQSL